jgi:hypothetical protein
MRIRPAGVFGRWDALNPWALPQLPKERGFAGLRNVSFQNVVESALDFCPLNRDTIGMDTGNLIYILSRLILGALASFLAIMLWSKTRDIAWMLMVIGTIAAYAGIVYSILGFFGITERAAFSAGSVPTVSLILVNLPACFFIAAFSVMIARKYH